MVLAFAHKLQLFLRRQQTLLELHFFISQSLKVKLHDTAGDTLSHPERMPNGVKMFLFHSARS